MATVSVQDFYSEQARTLPRALSDRAMRYAGDFAASLAGLPWQLPAGQRCLAAAPRVFALSDFVAHTCLTRPELLGDLIASGDLENPLDPDALTIRLHHAIAAADLTSLKQVLRQTRLRESVRVAWRDLVGQTDLAGVMADLSIGADVLISEALSWLERAAAERYGRPLDERSGQTIGLIVLGLGKLGGSELNFSSDVDLVFAYPEAGNTTGPHAIDNHTFFTGIGRQLIEVLGSRTADGHVFRVDMRLRPDGESGALALSFDAMEQYYQLHGREWERYALQKARVVAGDQATGERLLDRLRPFVYRRYLDYSAIDAMRDMKALINRELHRKDMMNHIKLGVGGIREIEFIVQVLQLIRGGRKPALQTRSLLSAIQYLTQGGYLTTAIGETLHAAYVFLRNTENRLQMIDDRQTHKLPQDANNRLRLATAMGYDDWDSFVADLDRHRHDVHAHFRQLFKSSADHQPDALAGVWLGILDADSAASALQSAGYDQPDEVLSLLAGLRQGTAYQAMSSRGRDRLDCLMPHVLEAAGHTDEPLIALSRLVNLIEAIGRRSAYFAQLLENPIALQYIACLCGASPWIAAWISQHPVVLDELIDPDALHALPDRETLAEELRQRLVCTGGDLEAGMDELREFRHGQMLRVAAADVGPGLAAEETSRRLTDIAEVILEQGLNLAWHNLEPRYHPDKRRPAIGPYVPGFAVIAYGKLGSQELGYSSDLDLVFLHTDTGPDNTFYLRLGQRLIHILTTPTRAGILYETDMRLRPSGRSGPLISSISAFRDYQMERAWTWEHQALVRARPITGDPDLMMQFNNIRREVLCLPRDPEKLRYEIIEMRDRMSAAQPAHIDALYNIKHDRGGLIDIEFLVQYWVLRHAHDYPALTASPDNAGQLAALTEAGLIDPAVAAILTQAYQHYLAAEHKLRLMEHKPLAEYGQYAETAEQVAAIWDSVSSGIEAGSATAR